MPKHHPPLCPPFNNNTAIFVDDKSLFADRLPMLVSCGSLTYLLSKTYGKISVEIVFEGYRTLSLAEWGAYCRLAGKSVKKSHLFWVREIFLVGNRTHLVKAKTLMPAPQLSGKLNRLKHLGNTPMGHILFNKYQKRPFVRQFVVQPHKLARQSLYDWYGQTVFVEEWFLT